MLEYNKGISLYDFLYENDTTSIEYINKNLKQTSLYFKRKNILNYHPLKKQENTTLNTLKTEVSQYIVSSGSTVANYKIKNTNKHTIKFYFLFFDNNNFKNINTLLLFSDIFKVAVYFKHNSFYYYVMLDKISARCEYIITNKNILHEVLIDNKYININFDISYFLNNENSIKFPEKFSTDYTVEGYNYIAIEKTIFSQQKIIMTEKMQNLLTEIYNIFDFVYSPRNEFVYIDNSDIIEIYKNDMTSSGIKILQKNMSKYYLLEFQDKIVLQKNIFSENFGDIKYNAAYFIDTTETITNDNNNCEYFINIKDFNLNNLIDKFEIIDSSNLYELNGKIYIKANSIINTNFIIDSTDSIVNYYTGNNFAEVINDNNLIKLRFINNTSNDVELTDFCILPYFSINNYTNINKYQIYDFTSLDININNVILLQEENNPYAYEYIKFDEALNTIQPIYLATKANDTTYNNISFDGGIFPSRVNFTGMLKVIYLSNTSDYYFETY